MPPTYMTTDGRMAWPHLDGRSVVGERRRCAARYRMPWTAPLPYAATRLVTVSHESDGDRLVPADPVSAAEQRRSAWTRPLIAKAFLGDVGCAIAVMAAALISYDGTITRVELLGVLLMGAVWPALLLLGGGYDARRL